MMKRVLLLLMLLTLLLSGCIPAGAGGVDSNARVVNQIQISLVPDNGSEPYRVYTDEEKLEWVLEYIESIQGEENPRKAPDNEIGCWKIICVYVSGEEKEYYLREGRFFREEGGNWLRIEEGNIGFNQFLLDNPSDELLTDERQADTEETAGGAIKIPNG